MIGNAITLDEFQAKAMKNGYFPSGVFEHPDTLGDNKDSFVKALDKRYAGPENARRPLILGKWHDVQGDERLHRRQAMIEQMKMSASQICGMLTCRC